MTTPGTVWQQGGFEVWLKPLENAQLVTVTENTGNVLHGWSLWKFIQLISCSQSAFPLHRFRGVSSSISHPQEFGHVEDDVHCQNVTWQVEFLCPWSKPGCWAGGCWPLKPWLGSAFNLFWGFKLSQWKAKPLRAGSGADKGISVRAPSQLCALNAADFRGVGRLSENTINSNCTILIVLFQAFPGISDLSTATNLDLSLGNSSETWRVFSESN